MRPLTPTELTDDFETLNALKVSVSVVDIENGSPKLGDMIARNPENHNDKWLVAAEYFKNNFTPKEGS